jgi:hypothetical protein
VSKIIPQEDGSVIIVPDEDEDQKKQAADQSPPPPSKGQPFQGIKGILAQPGTTPAPGVPPGANPQLGMINLLREGFNQAKPLLGPAANIGAAAAAAGLTGGSILPAMAGAALGSAISPESSVTQGASSLAGAIPDLMFPEMRTVGGSIRRLLREGPGPLKTALLRALFSGAGAAGAEAVQGNANPLASGAAYGAATGAGELGNMLLPRRLSQGAQLVTKNMEQETMGDLAQKAGLPSVSPAPILKAEGTGSVQAMVNMAAGTTPQGPNRDTLISLSKKLGSTSANAGQTGLRALFENPNNVRAFMNARIPMQWKVNATASWLTNEVFEYAPLDKRPGSPMVLDTAKTIRNLEENADSLAQMPEPVKAAITAVRMMAEKANPAAAVTSQESQKAVQWSFRHGIWRYGMTLGGLFGLEAGHSMAGAATGAALGTGITVAAVYLSKLFQPEVQQLAWIAAHEKNPAAFNLLVRSFAGAGTRLWNQPPSEPQSP